MEAGEFGQVKMGKEEMSACPSNGIEEDQRQKTGLRFTRGREFENAGARNNMRLLSVAGSELLVFPWTSFLGLIGERKESWKDH